MYQVEYLESVIKEDILKLPKAEKIRIKKAIEDRLRQDPLHFEKTLRYSLKNCRRMRVGPYRIIFKLESKMNQFKMRLRFSIVLTDPTAFVFSL